MAEAVVFEPVPEAALVEVLVGEEFVDGEERCAEDAGVAGGGPDVVFAADEQPGEELFVEFFDELELEGGVGFAPFGVLEPVGVLEHLLEAVEAEFGAGEFDVAVGAGVDAGEHAGGGAVRAED